VEVVVLTPQQDLVTCVAEAIAAGPDVLGMAGGDGSLALVAAAAMAHEVPFVCIPAGTRNHFALDIGVDRRDPVAALAAYVDGVERRVDVAEVNGRMFLNNVSLGIYGEAVREATYRNAKVRTLLETARRVMGPSGHVPELRLVDDVGREHTRCVVVLVSNNPYELQGPAVGTRPVLDGGHLGVVIVRAPDAGPPPAHSWSTSTFEVDAAAPLPAGVDGESVTLTPPLRFAVRAAALRIRVPASAVR
jgi:diacylglycerol kinase family enzyme